MIGTTQDWDWFCGQNYSVFDPLDNLTWNADGRQGVVDNACRTSAIYAVIQITFLCIFTALLLTLGCCSARYKSISTPYILRFPGHSVRWTITVLLLTMLVCSVAEGILTSSTNGTPLPHLYIAPIFGLMCVSASLVYNHWMELWRQPMLSWLLLVYWMASVTMDTYQLLGLIHNDLGDVNIVRFDVTVSRLVMVSILLLNELNLIRIKILHCFHDPNSILFPRDLKSPSMRYYDQYVSSLSSVFFYWLGPLLSLGYKRPLEVEDLGSLPEEDQAWNTYTKFRKAFLVEKTRALYTGTKPNLWRVYLRVHGFQIAKGTGARLVADCFGYVGPIVIGGITNYAVSSSGMEQENPTPHYIEIGEFFSNGYVLLMLAFLSLTMNGLFLHNGMYWQGLEGIKLKSSMQAMVYEKSLRLSSFTTNSNNEGSMTMGEITNYMAVDAMSLFWASVASQFVIMTPFNIIVTLVLLNEVMGLSALLGALVIVVILPLQLKVAKNISIYQKKMLKYSDQRLKQSNELLHGIKLLKLYGWEEIYELAVEAIRRKELKCLFQLLLCTAATVAFTSFTPTLMTLVALVVYPSVSGSNLRPDVAFSSIALFNQLMVPLWSLPLTISSMVNAAVSTKRLTAFLLAPEVHEEEENRDWNLLKEGDEEDCSEEDQLYSEAGYSKDGYTVLYNSTGKESKDATTSLLPRVTSPNGHTYGAIDGSSSLTSSLKAHGLPIRKLEMPLDESIAIKISDGCFTWDPDSTKPILSNIDVQIPAGKLTMIVGQVGMGKSSLLAAMLGEMAILNGTVQYNSEKRSVAYAAQKAWLCNDSLRNNILFGKSMDEKRYHQVLEACALGPDIDILPAGDLTEIGEKGINLSGGQKQRISVARAMYTGKDIVILDDPLSALDVHVGGHLFQEGFLGILLKEKKTVILVTHQLQYLESADKILVLKDGYIANEGTFQEISTADPTLYSSWRSALQLASESEADPSGNESQSEMEREDLRKRVRRQSSNKDKTVTMILDTSNDKGKLIEEEEMERGSVSYKVYLFYGRSMSLLVLGLAATFMALSVLLQMATTFWISEWSEAGLQNNETVSSDYYIQVYAALQSVLIVNSLLGIFVLNVGCYLASKHLHYGMLRNIIRVPLRFFDITPIGRVLNRFSNDTQQVDVKICMTLYIIQGGVVIAIAAVLVNSIITPWFIALVIPMVFLYLYVQKYYLTSSRELQRLDSVTKSPVFAYFSETLNGLETIRAYKEQHRFFKTIIKRINTNLISFLYLRTLMGWMGTRLNFVGAWIVLLAGGSSLIGASLNGVSASLVGLSLTWALSIAGYLNFLVRSAADLEIMMNSVERIKHYTLIENEDYGGMAPPYLWPQFGEITIEGVSARYAKELDPVLKQVSIYIRPGEKVGICGRTGSGKSSLTLSLFRIIDMFQGHIIIDDIDISSIPLLTLRQKISIIPQDPVLFTGTIRQNLDPEGHRSDEELWNGVEIAQLKDVVQGLTEGLDFMVTEGGENFSMGQRQLFCLARAFLRKSRILIMDEATASIDMQTDKTLQKVVASAFADRTVLIIAHRVTTILNCDTILVLSEGEVMEYDSPDNLLAREDSMFAAFVKAKK